MKVKCQSRLGDKLFYLRKSKNQSLREVEKHTGISNPYLSQLENGYIKTPSPIMLRTLANHYETTYSELMILAEYLLPDELITKNKLELRANRREIMKKLIVRKHENGFVDEVVAGNLHIADLGEQFFMSVTDETTYYRFAFTAQHNNHIVLELVETEPLEDLGLEKPKTKKQT